MDGFLKENLYYEDLYDLHTIELCLKYGRDIYSKFKESKNSGKEEDWLKGINIVILSIKVSRFKERVNTLANWMAEDKSRQDKFDGAQEEELYCPNCNVLLEVFLKELYERNTKNLRVLFFYKCPRCNYREGRFDNGDIYQHTKTICEKCSGEINVEIKTNKRADITTWIYTCSDCDYKKIEKDDHKKWQQEYDSKKQKEKALLEKYRHEFCFSEKEGKEVVNNLEQLSDVISRIKENERKNQDPAIQKARKVNQLKVVELNKLLKSAIAKENYTELQFEKPDFSRFVSVPFIVQDEKSERDKYDSEKELKKLITKTLENTNWKLMSEGIRYRAGYLSGRLRCYEDDESLAEAIKVEKDSYVF